MGNERMYQLTGLDEEIMKNYLKDKKIIRNNIRNATLYEIDEVLVSYVHDSMITSNKRVVKDIVSEHIEKCEEYDILDLRIN